MTHFIFQEFFIQRQKVLNICKFSSANFNHSPQIGEIVEIKGTCAIAQLEWSARKSLKVQLKRITKKVSRKGVVESVESVPLE
jgi:hypothetical protein